MPREPKFSIKEEFNSTTLLPCFTSFFTSEVFKTKKQKRKCPLRVPLRLKGEEGVAGLNAKFNTHPLLWFLRVSRLKWRT
jgi:hypothetical protein